MISTGLEPRDADVIEADIARTRASLNRKLQELERRLSPSRRVAEVRRRINPGRFDPRHHPEWIAAAAVVAGALMAFAGWRRSRPAGTGTPELEDLVIFEAVCEDPLL